MVSAGRAAEDVLKDLIADVALLRGSGWRVSSRLRMLGGARARPSWCHCATSTRVRE